MVDKKRTYKRKVNEPNSNSIKFTEISNPYSAYDIESSKWFYHEDLIDKVKNNFESSLPQKLIVIHGMIGSGKTSTLRKMVNEPKLLGDNYVPIYIKLGEYTSKDIGTQLLYFYNKIKESLRDFGYRVDEPIYSYDSSISLDEMKRFILRVENTLSDQVIIILIVDDFVELRQEVYASTKIEVFDFFSHILKERNIFRLILAGKVDITQSFREIKIRKLLNDAYIIELGMFLDFNRIEKLIVEPLADKLEYQPEALKEIIRITGRNFYCQQLLCYYLVDYLNEKKKNICTLDDVHHAVDRALSDKREDFIYFWNNLDYENKILHAALADERITKQEGSFYSIKDSLLLDSILGENRLNETLKKSHIDQHINKIDGRRFDDYPFKIPLYGQWVNRTHALSKTIVENWAKIIENVTLSNLGKILESIPLDTLPFDREVRRNAIEISKKWSLIKKNLVYSNIDESLVKDLVYVICKILKFKIIEETNFRKNVFVIDISQLNLVGFKNVLLFAIPMEELSENDVEYIHDKILLEDKPANPSLVLYFKKSENIQLLTRRHYLGIVLVNERDLIKCSLSSTPTQVFKKDVLIKQIKPSAISLYKIEGPVTQTFYGRHEEIGMILGKKVRNFAIVGARKIGKTSLLFKIISGLPKNTVPVYLDVDSPDDQNYVTFLATLQDELKERYDEKINFTNDLSNFYSVIKKLKQTGRKPMFFIDEVDNLIKFDEGNHFKLLSIFRSLAQERYCQLIISGFERLYHTKKKLKSPLYNFLEFITLDKLKKQDALDLVTEPMKRIGIKYSNDITRELILEYTSYHPNLIQFFCKRLVEEIQDRNEEKYRRTISEKDIDKLYNSFEYEKYVINDFYLFFTQDIEPVERLIVLLLARKYSDKKTFSVPEIRETLKDHKINLSLGRLTDYAANLRLRYILLGEIGGRFRFALPIFPKMLNKRDDIEYLIEEAIEDAKKSL
ncbi:AAA family ATPase [Acidobacteriota bacterium]